MSAGEKFSYLGISIKLANLFIYSSQFCEDQN